MSQTDWNPGMHCGRMKLKHISMGKMDPPRRKTTITANERPMRDREDLPDLPAVKHIWYRYDTIDRAVMHISDSQNHCTSTWRDLIGPNVPSIACYMPTLAQKSHLKQL